MECFWGGLITALVCFVPVFLLTTLLEAALELKPESSHFKPSESQILVTCEQSCQRLHVPLTHATSWPLQTGSGILCTAPGFSLSTSAPGVVCKQCCSETEHMKLLWEPFTTELCEASLSFQSTHGLILKASRRRENSLPWGKSSTSVVVTSTFAKLFELRFCKNGEINPDGKAKAS